MCLRYKLPPKICQKVVSLDLKTALKVSTGAILKQRRTKVNQSAWKEK